MPPPDRPARPSPESKEERAKRLREEIRRHNRLYHEQDRPRNPRFRVRRALPGIARTGGTRIRELVTPDSPTQSVGRSDPARPLRRSSTARACCRWRTSSTLKKWRSSIAAWPRLLDDEETEREYSAEPKLDGVALSLLYERGITGAGGHPWGRPGTGEDVTHTARTIQSVTIPAQLTGE